MRAGRLIRWNQDDTPCSAPSIIDVCLGMLANCGDDSPEAKRIITERLVREITARGIR